MDPNCFLVQAVRWALETINSNRCCLEIDYECAGDEIPCELTHHICNDVWTFCDLHCVEGKTRIMSRQYLLRCEWVDVVQLEFWESSEAVAATLSFPPLNMYIAYKSVIAEPHNFVRIDLSAQVLSIYPCTWQLVDQLG